MINLDVVGSRLVQRGDTTVALDQEGLGTKSSSDIYWKRNESESQHRESYFESSNSETVEVKGEVRRFLFICSKLLSAQN